MLELKMYAFFFFLPCWYSGMDRRDQVGIVSQTNHRLLLNRMTISIGIISGKNFYNLTTKYLHTSTWVSSKQEAVNVANKNKKNSDTSRLMWRRGTTSSSNSFKQKRIKKRSFIWFRLVGRCCHCCQCNSIVSHKCFAVQNALKSNTIILVLLFIIIIIWIF